MCCKHCGGWSGPSARLGCRRPDFSASVLRKDFDAQSNDFLTLHVSKLKLKILRLTVSPSCSLTEDQMLSHFYNILKSYPQLKDQLLSGEESQVANIGFS